MDGQQSGIPGPDRDRSLEEVIDDFGRSLCPGGPYGEIDEWSVYDENFRRLVLWAREAGCLYEGLQPLKEGGREHDLLFDPETLTWLKFTKPAAAGYAVSFDFSKAELGPALPLEYLQRLKLQNELFADSIRFVGVGGTSRSPRLITRQNHIRGEMADLSAIRDLMRSLGFPELPTRFSLGYADSLAFASRDAAVFDLRPANVVLTPEGLAVPIDAIVCPLDAEARSILGLDP